MISSLKKIISVLFSIGCVINPVLQADEIHGQDIVFQEPENDLDELSEFNLDDLKAWEQENPPQFFPTVKLLITEHIKQNKAAYAISTGVAIFTAWCFKDHLWEYKNTYIASALLSFGITITLAWYQFNKRMQQKE